MSNGDIGTLGIVELVDVCREMAGRSRALFRQVGRRVADEDDTAMQRWYAVGSHRHAWHAELWDERLPTIPVDGAPDEDDVAAPAGDSDDYREQLEQMVTDLDGLSSRIDDALDPGTARVITLVRADLLDLLAQAPA